MSLLDDLRNLLARHLAHVQSGTNQGVARLIEDHLARLEAVVSAGEAEAEARVHEILGELYAATNAPAPAVEQPPAAPAKPVVLAEPDPAPVDAPVDAPAVDAPSATEPAAPAEAEAAETPAPVETPEA